MRKGNKRFLEMRVVPRENFSEEITLTRGERFFQSLTQHLTYRNFLKVTGTFIATTLALYSMQLITPDEGKNDTAKDMIDPVFSVITKGFDDLRHEFPHQNERFWRVFKSAIRPIIDIPQHPAVILMTTSKRNSATSECLAKKMSQKVNDAFGAELPVVVLDCHKFLGIDPDEVKRVIDDKLTEAFTNGAKVAILLSIESLPGKSPMIFYRFCDTANAPFKNIVIIMTLNIENEPDSENDHSAYKEMTRLWSPVLDQDQVTPLFSRIGNSVAFVKEEDGFESCRLG